MKQLKVRVENLLRNKRELRDDYIKLILTYWVKYDKVDKDKSLVNIYMIADTLTPPESITRASRWVQEKNEDLRGENYLKRHKKQEEYKEEFKY